LRILDSKNPALEALIGGAPKMIEFIADKSLAHFDGLKALLAESAIAFQVDPRLVRGLDYYNRTVFEWVTDRLGAQGTVAGGGRYDGLFEQLGGKRSFACGFAIGIERMVLLLQEAATVPVAAPLAYVVHLSEAGAKLASRVGEMLRDAGNAIVVNAGGGSIKSQMKKADASGAAFALIIGEDEVAAGNVSVKPLRGGGEQIAVSVGDVAAAISARQ
jgi:histidyl-tRNA synthetase